MELFAKWFLIGRFVKTSLLLALEGIMVKTNVRIDGMACNMCENHVCDAVREAFDIKKVRASHKTGLLEIVAEKAFEKEDLDKALSDTGYKVLEVSSEPYVKKGLFGF